MLACNPSSFVLQVSASEIESESESVIESVIVSARIAGVFVSVYAEGCRSCSCFGFCFGSGSYHGQSLVRISVRGRGRDEQAARGTEREYANGKGNVRETDPCLGLGFEFGR